MPEVFGTSKSVYDFDPLSVPGCTVWLDAADSNTMTFSSGSNIATWRDKASGLYASNTTTNYQPSYSPASQNNLGTVFFDATAGLKFIDIPPFSWGTTTRSCFFVMKNLASGANSDGFAQYPHWFWDRVNGNDPNVWTLIGWTNIREGGNNAQYIFPLNQYVIYELVYSNSTITQYQSGTQTQNYSTYSSFYDATNGYKLGGLPPERDEGVYRFYGNIAEVLLFNTAVTTSQRQQIEGYLAWKWGIENIPVPAVVGGVQPLQALTNGPLDIPGCALWLDAADRSTLTLSGSKVTQWNDKSGSGNNFVPASASSIPVVATGGTITDVNGYRFHTFTTNGTFTLTTPSSTSVEVLVVGGGGCGGGLSYDGGGGGAGGAVLTSLSVSGSTSVVVGAGGVNCSNGDSSSFGSLSVVGGGYGGSFYTPTYTGGDGGCGGGGNARASAVGGTGSVGYNGGQGQGGGGGGGGGMGGVGADGNAGNGGLGGTFVIGGVSYFLAGGGGGGRQNVGETAPGSAGGGAGGLNNQEGQPAVANTGSGGGGTSVGGYGGSGGSGIVIIAYVFYPGTPTAITDMGRPVVNFQEGVIMSSINQILVTASTAFYTVFRITALSGQGIDYVLGLTNTVGTQTSDCGYRFVGDGLIGSGSITGGIQDLGNSNYYVNGTFNPSFSLSTYSNSYAIVGNTVSSMNTTTYLTISTAFSGPRAFIGNISEVLYYPNGLSTVQRQQLEGYLGKKWGITVVTPGSINSLSLWLDGADPTTMSFGAVPTSYFPFNGTIIDQSNIITLTKTGSVPYVPGKYNQAVSFTNARNDTQSTNYLSTSYTLPSTFSVSMWFMIVETADVFNSIFYTNSNPSELTGAIIIYGLGNRLYHSFSGIGGATSIGATINADTWYQLMITYNNGTLLCYLNGSQSGGSVTATASLNGFTFGGGYRGGVLTYNGYIDELCIYNSVLTSTQISNMYSQKVVSWRDKSGYGSNAIQTTLANSPTASGSGVTFNASSNQFMTLNVPYTSSHTIFIVATPTSASQVYLFGRGSGVTGGAPTMILNYNGTQLQYYPASDGSSTSTFGSPTSTFVACYVRNYGTSVIGTLNGAQVFTSVSPTSEPHPTVAWSHLGQSGVGDNYYTGTIYEFMIYGTALTTSQRQTVEAYLSTKWGIASSGEYTALLRSPAIIPGCVVWCDASQDGALGNLSSGGYTTTTTGTLKPNGKGGLNTVTLNTSQRWTTSPELSLSAYTLFWVGRQTGGTNGRVLVGTTNNQLFGYWGGHKKVIYIDGNPNILYTADPDTSWDLMSHSRTAGGSYTFNWNGVPLFSSSSSTGNPLAGLAINTYGGEASDCEVAEIIVFNQVLSTTQIRGIERYLSLKWGLSDPYTTVPGSIDGLELWLDAADSTTITGTTTMTAWKDKSTNGYTANSFSNSVGAPSWISNAPNVGTAVQYSAGNGSSIANFVLAQTMSIFEVYYAINQSTSGPFIEHGPDENSNSGFYLYSGGGQNFGINSGSGQIAVNFGNVTLSNTWQLIEGINPDPANSSTMAFYVNGQVKASGATQSGTTPVTRTLFINGRNGANSVSYNAYLAELIIFSKALTAGQRQAIESYLSRKWNIPVPTEALPVTHPFTSIKPLARQFNPVDLPGCMMWLDMADPKSVCTGFTETFSNSSVSYYTYYGSSGNWTWTNGGISYGSSPFAISPLSTIPDSLGYSSFIQVFGSTPSTATRATSVPAGVPCTLSFWYCSRDANHPPASITASYGSTTIVTITSPISASLWTNSTTTFMSYAANQNLVFSVTLSSDGYNDQTGNIAFVRLTYPASSSDPVIQIVDKSVKGNTMTAFSSYSNASVSTAYQNGLNVLNFSGNGVYRTQSNSSFYPLDCYVVLALKDLLTTVDVIGVTATTVDSFNSLTFAEHTAKRWHNGSSYFTRTPATVSSTDETSTSFLLMNWSIADSNYILRRNGVQLTQTNAYTFPNLAVGSVFQLGARYTYIDHPFRGYIGELIVFNSQLDPNQRLQVEGYLASKWGLRSSLPSTHSFYRFPPSTVVPFTPRTIPDCTIWLDASQDTTPSGSNVSMLFDRSGSGNHFKPYTNYAISLTGSALNNTSVYRFGYNTAYNPSISWGTAFTQIVVVKGNGYYITCTRTSPGVYGSYVYAGNWGLLYVSQAVGANDAELPYNNRIFLRSSTGITGWNIFCIGYTPGSYYATNYTLNGTVRKAATGVTYAPDVYACPMYINGTPDANDNTDIAEFIHFNRALTTAQRQQIEGYLAQKWGLAENLPPTHPYRRLPIAQTPSSPVYLPGLYVRFFNRDDTPDPWPYGYGWGAPLGTAGPYQYVSFGDMYWPDRVYRLPQEDTIIVYAKGYFYSPVADTLSVSTLSDDGIQVILGGNAIINNWTYHGGTTDTSSFYSVPAGYTPFYLMMFEGGGGAVCELSWRTSGTSYTNNLAGRFFYDASDP